MSDIELKPEDRVLFVINDNTIHGSTRFQKYAFLLHKQYQKELLKLKTKYPEFDFYKDWEAHYFGPYSKDLEKDIDQCIADNILRKIKCEDEKSKKTTNIYSLTLVGRVKWRKFFNSVPDEIIKINEKINQLQHRDFYTLLRQIYDVYPEYTVNSTIKEKLN